MIFKTLRLILAGLRSHVTLMISPVKTVIFIHLTGKNFWSAFQFFMSFGRIATKSASFRCFSILCNHVSLLRRICEVFRDQWLRWKLIENLSSSTYDLEGFSDFHIMFVQTFYMFHCLGGRCRRFRRRFFIRPKGSNYHRREYGG